MLAVSLWQSGPNVLSITCHEAWHVVSPRLRDDLLADLDAALSGAVVLGDDPYWSSLEERRARAFEYWCSSFLNGCPPRPRSGFVDELFDAVWRGDFGAEVVKKGLV